jgi:LEA14-like dessication related protein
MKQMPARIYVMAMALFLAGCAGVTTRPPDVSLAGIELRDVSLFEQKFRLKLRLTNPGEREFVINGISCEIELNGHAFARGVADRTVMVPRYGEAVLDLDATSALSGVLQQLHELSRGRERIDYRIHGHISLGGLGSIPFERRGDVALPRLLQTPEAAPPGHAHQLT